MDRALLGQSDAQRHDQEGSAYTRKQPGGCRRRLWLLRKIPYTGGYNRSGQLPLTVRQRFCAQEIVHDQHGIGLCHMSFYCDVRAQRSAQISRFLIAERLSV